MRWSARHSRAPVEPPIGNTEPRASGGLAYPGIRRGSARAAYHPPAQSAWQVCNPTLLYVVWLPTTPDILTTPALPRPWSRAFEWAGGSVRRGVQMNEVLDDVTYWLRGSVRVVKKLPIINC